MKKCSNSKCIHKGKMQPLSNFYYRYNRNMYENTCKDCRREQRKKRYHNNPDYYKKQNQDWYNDNSENVIKRTVQWGKDNKEKRRKITRKSNKKRYWGKKFIFYIAFINLKIKKNVV